MKYIRHLKLVFGSIRCQIFYKIFESSSSFVILYRVISRFEQFDSWEPFYLHIFHFICGGIELCNDNFLVIFKLFSKFIPDWCQFFTMSTPWSVEFNQYVLLRIGIPILWDGIRLQMGLQVSCLPGSNKSSEV